jgi:hypothetical protein
LEQNGAPSVVVNQVRNRLPAGEYRSPQDLIKRLRARFKTCQPPLTLRTPTGQLRLPIGLLEFAMPCEMPVRQF